MGMGLLDDAAEIADRLRAADRVHVVSHIDADGLASGAVATEALDRAGIDHDIEFVKTLTEDETRRVAEADHELVWFVDLGAGVVPLLEELGVACCIADHHVPEGEGSLHLNPHLHGLEGSRWISGGGAAYLVARELPGDHRDLAATAIVGAVGDLQDRDRGRLVGGNRLLVEEAREAGALATRIDTRYYGRETRPVPKVLEYADDPVIPGVSGRERAANGFLEDLGIPTKLDGEWRGWRDLSRSEKTTIISGVARRLLEKGFGAEAVDRLVGEVYVLADEEPGTPVRDATEFSTLLNSCGRYQEYETGLAVARGDRDEAYDRALQLLRGHRANLVDGINLVQDQGIEEREHLQTFHAGDGIPETIVGIVAGMMYNTEGVRRDLPIVAFAEADPGEVKVSSRATQALVEAGVDLSEVMNVAADAVEGGGGGHAPAAGATIPEGEEERFLDRVEEAVERQLDGEPAEGAAEVGADEAASEGVLEG
jgi:RecJ-like exonuclease